MRRTCLLLFVLILIPFAAPAAQAENPIPLKILRNTWIVVPVTIDGAGTFDFLLDSGTNTTILQTGFARSLGLTPVDRVELLTATGSRVVPRSHLSEIRVGAASASGIEVLWSDMPEIRSLDAGICGVLGTNFLARFNYRIDYRAGRIEFETGDEIERRTVGRRIPLRERDGRLIISVQAGCYSLEFVLDAGASVVVLFDRARRRLGDHLSGIEKANFVMVTDAGRAAVETARLANCEIGGEMHMDLLVALAPAESARTEDGLLPMRLFPAIYINQHAGYAVIG